MSSDNRAVALANNDVSQIGWCYSAPIPKCLGFAIYRVDLTTNPPQREPLPAWVGFKGGANKQWKARTTREWPIQKFNWRDLTARRGRTYHYEIVPMIGAPGHLEEVAALKLTTNPVTLSPACGPYAAYFNRGILSTQHVAHAIPSGPSGLPNYKVLRDRIDQPGDPLRKSLAGQIVEALLTLLDRARREGGLCYAALYELSDPELLSVLLNSPYLRLILSNTGDSDEVNDAGRQSLHEAGVDVTDRMLSSGHIGHNKFMIYVDRDGKPQAVLTGSTNWTATGVCAQSNNALLIESPKLAAAYFDYWKRLKADEAEQDADFRQRNRKSHTAEDIGATLWFSPNTDQKNKPSKNPRTPLDLEEVFSVMHDARQSILFLAFQPGQPSIVETAAECLAQNPQLFLRGAATDPGVPNKFLDTVDLYHGSAAADAVVPATAIDDQFSFWEAELLKSSPTAHAIIHDKIVVVDPFSENCCVITGSHNLGFRASYNNDENLLIIRGNRPLAEAYAVHVMDVYDHYRWRYTLAKGARKNAWFGLDTTPKWQDKYFAHGAPAHPELKFWLQKE